MTRPLALLLLSALLALTLLPSVSVAQEDRRSPSDVWDEFPLGPGATAEQAASRLGPRVAQAKRSDTISAGTLVLLAAAACIGGLAAFVAPRVASTRRSKPASRPRTEPEPAVVKPKPTATKPKPAVMQPKPTATEPKPAAAKPKPAAAKPKPAAIQPKPAAMKPEPASSTPARPARKPKRAAAPAKSSADREQAAAKAKRTTAREPDAANSEPRSAPAEPLSVAPAAPAPAAHREECRIKLHNRAIRAHFFAVPYDGGPVLARSPHFKMRRAGGDNGASARDALRALVEELTAAGWRQTRVGRAPWDLRFQRDADPPRPARSGRSH